MIYEEKLWITLTTWEKVVLLILSYFELLTVDSGVFEGVYSGPALFALVWPPWTLDVSFDERSDPESGMCWKLLNVFPASKNVSWAGCIYMAALWWREMNPH